MDVIFSAWRVTLFASRQGEESFEKLGGNFVGLFGPAKAFLEGGNHVLADKVLVGTNFEASKTQFLMALRNLTYGFD